MILGKLLSLFTILTMSSLCFGYGLGVSTHPMETGKKFVNGELTSVIQGGSGMGLQARFVQRFQEKFTYDIGAGFANGARSNRIFAGLDTMIFPDYKYQPRTSIRAYVENAKEFDSRHNIIGLAPVVSKGFSFWEHEAYPFFAVPMELNLNGGNNSYETSVRLSFGATAPINLKDGKTLVANVEANINLTESFSGIFLGVSYPL